MGVVSVTRNGAVQDPRGRIVYARQGHGETNPSRLYGHCGSLLNK